MKGLVLLRATSASIPARGGEGALTRENARRVASHLPSLVTPMSQLRARRSLSILGHDGRQMSEL